MKVVARNQNTLIYPLLELDAEISYREHIIVCPGEAIKLKGFYGVSLTPQEARTLAQALEYAAGLAEAGRECEH